jgi:hypothetical protein
MMTTTNHHGHASPLGQLDLRFGSNAVRLGLRAWLVAGAILLAFIIAMPRVWERIEPLPPETADSRIPYRLSNDYWQFSRYAARAAESDQTIVLGDSVVWGEYVAPNETLTACLNRRANNQSLSPGGRGTSLPAEAVAAAGEGAMKFVNLGVDGTYPAAMASLVDYYGGAIRNRRVILHFNPLWLATPRHDLRDEKAGPLNHPALMPQFIFPVDSYDETTSRRIGIVVGRNVPFFQWGEHLKLAYFSGQDVPTWTLDHPYSNPLNEIRPETVGNDDPPRHAAIPWTAAGIEKQDFPWMNLWLDHPVQWRGFLKTLYNLKSQNNRVIVIIGPMNEHMLTPESLAAYREMLDQIRTEFASADIRYINMKVLPSEMYADASHPLAAGYDRLAEDLLKALPDRW